MIPDKLTLDTGAIVRFPMHDLLMVDARRQNHSAGYGDVDGRAVCLSGVQHSSGTIISTPFGQLEIINKSRLLPAERTILVDHASQPSRIVGAIPSDAPSLPTRKTIAQS